MDLKDLSIGGVGLIFLIIGLVQFIKEQGWVTKPASLKLTAALTGMFFGALYVASQTWPGIVQYISGFVFVLAAGLAATGLFDFSKEVAGTAKK